MSLDLRTQCRLRPTDTQRSWPVEDLSVPDHDRIEMLLDLVARLDRTLKKLIDLSGIDLYDGRIWYGDANGTSSFPASDEPILEEELMGWDQEVVDPMAPPA